MRLAALCTEFYIFCKIHRLQCVTPAIEAELVDTVEDFDWALELLNSQVPKLNPSSSCKKLSPKMTDPGSMLFSRGRPGVYASGYSTFFMKGK